MNSGLTIVGDIAYPFENCVNISQLYTDLAGSILVGNLEGPILQTPENSMQRVRNKYKYNLYSSHSFLEIAKLLNFMAFSVANNHSCDFKEGLKETEKICKSEQIKLFGTRDRPYAVLENSDQKFCILGYCQKITGIGDWTKKNDINIVSPIDAIKQIIECRNTFKNVKLVVFVHWGLELHSFPTPADREWAHLAIDAGADIVVGHHPHVIQGYEFYKGKHIIYSIGNFILPEVNYCDKKLVYNDQRVFECLAVNYNHGAVKFLLYKYIDVAANVLKKQALSSQEIINMLKELTPFSGLSSTQYQKWYKNKVQTKSIIIPKLSPILYSYAGKYRLATSYKLAYLAARQYIRRLAIQFGLHTPWNWH